MTIPMTSNQTTCFTSIQHRTLWTFQPPPPPQTLQQQPPPPPKEQCRQVELCPSMDLVAYYCDTNSSSSSSSSSSASMMVHIHRTLNWQRIASTTVTTNDNNQIGRTSGSSSSTSNTNISHIDMERPTDTTTTTMTTTSGIGKRMEWSPDGRFLAVACHRTVHIYSVEGLLLQFSSTNNNNTTMPLRNQNDGDDTPDTLNSCMVIGGDHSDGIVVTDDEENDINGGSSSSSSNHPAKVFTFSLPTSTDVSDPKDFNVKDHKNDNKNNDNNSILSLSWVHLGSWCEHHLWPKSNDDHDDDDDDDMGNDNDHYHLNYNDQQNLRHQYYSVMEYQHRSRYVLPPSHYHAFYTTNVGGGGGDGDDIDDFAGISDTNLTNHRQHSSSKSMSLLCAMTISGHLSIYWYGRYPIVWNVPQFWLQSSSSSSSSSLLSPVNHVLYHPVVASPDLTHFITAITPSSSSSLITQHDDDDDGNHNGTSSNIIINSFPVLSQYRDSYEMIASLYSQTQQHIDTIRTSITEIVATWKSTFKPLDLKLDGLQKLFINYGLLQNPKPVTDSGDDDDQDNRTDILGTSKASHSNSIPSLLIHYILSGHTAQNGGTTLSNAMDQFFTGVQMNDQLVQRMGVTLFHSLANMESTIRKLLVAPATALLYVMDQLYGISAHRTDLFVPLVSTTTDMNTTSTGTTCLDLLHAVQQLSIMFNMTLTAIMDARSRVRVWVAWLRSTGATIKARGTATDSVQRENAKKRRISETVVQQLLSYLQESNIPNGKTCSGNFIGLTETILNLRVSDLLREPMIHDDPNILPNTFHSPYPSSSIPRALHITSQLADVIFAQPRSLLLQYMKQTVIQLPNQWDKNGIDATHNSKCLAITTRLGQGGINTNNISFGNPPPSGYFTPSTQNVPSQNDFKSSSPVHVRQWMIVAQSIPSNSIQLSAFPLTWPNTGDDNDNDDVLFCYDDDNTNDDIDDSNWTNGLYTKAKWNVVLQLPTEYNIRDIAFYCDNGKSTLSSSSSSTYHDSMIPASTLTGVGSQQEGRQSLGLLLSRPAHMNSIKGERVELWLLPYDDLIYTPEPLQSVNEGIKGNEVTTNRKVEMYKCNRNQEFYNEKCTSYYTVLPMTTTVSPNDGNDDDSERHIRYARTRTVLDTAVESSSHATSCQLILSGSRGIGSVIWNHTNDNTTNTTTSTIDIFDVEEDEEEEEEDEGDNMEEDGAL